MTELKTKRKGLYFLTINHAIQVFFKFIFLGFVDAAVMFIDHFVLFETWLVINPISHGVFDHDIIMGGGLKDPQPKT